MRRNASRKLMRILGSLFIIQAIYWVMPAGQFHVVEAAQTNYSVTAVR